MSKTKNQQPSTPNFIRENARAALAILALSAAGVVGASEFQEHRNPYGSHPAHATTTEHPHQGISTAVKHTIDNTSK